jgi:spore coat polysaccharide biosynthesis protein SpsF
MKKAVVITVRLKSTRLEEKVVREVNGKLVLKYMTDRLKHNFDGDIIICTSTHPQDDPLIDFANKEGLKYFRGSEEDVLERYYQTCVAFNLDKFYIVYGDEPWTDIETMNETFDMLDNDIAMWVKNDSLPEGTYGYGMTMKGIEYLNNNKLAEDLEVWQLMATKMPIKTIENKTDYRDRYEDIRLTIDYPDDLKVFAKIIDKIGNKHVTVNLNDLVSLYENENYYSINGFRIEQYKARILDQGTID